MLMEGKTGFIAGVANHRSIAWSIARALDREGAKLALGYLSDREKKGIEKIVGAACRIHRLLDSVRCQ